MQKFEHYKNWRLVVVPHKMLSFRTKGSFESNCTGVHHNLGSNPQI